MRRRCNRGHRSPHKRCHANSLETRAKASDRQTQNLDTQLSVAAVQPTIILRELIHKEAPKARNGGGLETE